MIAIMGAAPYDLRSAFSSALAPLLMIAVMALVGGCGRARLAERTPRDATMFGPNRMRIHPIFTQVKDWTADGIPDGVEALIEFQDRFDDPTKASGSAVFELFEFRPYNPDPRGRRVADPWIGSLLTLEEQRARWNSTLATYTFRLTFDRVSERRTYVLAAAFDRAAGAGGAGGAAGGAARFFDQIILETQRKEPTVDQQQPVTRPVAP